MNARFATALSFVLLTGVLTAFTQADDSPKLPDQYAEAVFQVEGMI